jgi:hypothetical protein
VRAQFGQLLGLHALVAVRQMRSLVAAAPELQRALDGSLQANTDALSRLVAEAYGGAPADRFTPRWQRHLADLVAYAKAVAGNDSSATQTARAALLGDADAYGAWLAGASQGRVRASDAAAGVRLHVQELMAQPTPTPPATTPGPTGLSASPMSTCSAPAPPWPRRA